MAHTATNTEFFMITRDEVMNLRAGDLAPDWAGCMRPVVEIHAQRDDIHGKAFACYYTESPSGNGSASNSMKEGELLITTRLSARYSGDELRQIEARMWAEREVQ
jgi:hypothetical protein